MKEPTDGTSTSKRDKLKRSCNESIETKRLPSAKKTKNSKQNLTTVVIQTQPVRNNKQNNHNKSLMGMATTNMNWDDSKELNEYSDGETENEKIPEKSLSHHALLSTNTTTMAFGTNGLVPKVDFIQTPASGQITILTTKSTRALLKIETKDLLFQMNKFVEDNDLSFSNDPNSICRQLAAKLNIPQNQVEYWWSDQKKDVLKSFHCHRNNVIKSMGIKFKGMILYMLVIYSYLYIEFPIIYTPNLTNSSCDLNRIVDSKRGFPL